MISYRLLSIIFHFRKSINELYFYATEHGCFNVEDILNNEEEEWTAPRWAKINDIVFFMHSKTAVASITKLNTELEKNKDDYSVSDYQLLKEWLKKGRFLYGKYGGKIFAVGRISGSPETVDVDYEDTDDFQFHWKSRVIANISDIFVLQEPIDISEFNQFIMVSRQSGITPVLGEEYENLKQVISRKNVVPEFFQNSVSSAIPLFRVTKENWFLVPKDYRRRFLLEAQFRSYYVNYLLSELGDMRTLLKECRCIKSGIPDSFVDNLVFINGKYLPVEVKLSVSLEKNIKNQVVKYCFDDYIQTKEKKILPDRIYQNRVLVIDTESVYMFDADDNSLEKIFDLDLIDNNNRVRELKEIILQIL